MRFHLLVLFQAAARGPQISCKPEGLPGSQPPDLSDQQFGLPSLRLRSLHLPHFNDLDCTRRARAEYHNAMCYCFRRCEPRRDCRHDQEVATEDISEAET